MSTQPRTCNCNERIKSTSTGGAIDASETAAKRAGVAEYTFLGTGPKAVCTFLSYEARYRYLRGVAVCNTGVTFPCCTTTSLSCGSCGSNQPG